MRETAEAAGAPIIEGLACRWLGVHRTPIRYASRRAPDTELRARLRELAATHARWGGPRLAWLLVREGRPDSDKRIEWVYREESLAVRRGSRKRVARGPRAAATAGGTE